MFSISKRAELAIYVMVELARDPAAQRSNDDLAASLGVGTHHLAKVLQTLARARWIAGTRGARGGYQLAADPRGVSMADVIELFEGQTRLERCGLPGDEPPCHRPGACQVGRVFQEINEQAYYTLKSINLQLLAHPPAPFGAAPRSPEARPSS